MASTTTQGLNLIKMVVDPTSSGAQDSTSCNVGTSPFRPGKKLKITLPVALAATSAFKLQQAPRFDDATGAKPATGSSLWTDLVAFAASAAPSEQEVAPAADTYHIRANVTTAHADTPVEVDISTTQ